jgi:hypothetical protein
LKSWGVWLSWFERFLGENDLRKGLSESRQRFFWLKPRARCPQAWGSPVGIKPMGIPTQIPTGVKNWTSIKRERVSISSEVYMLIDVINHFETYAKNPIIFCRKPNYPSLTYCVVHTPTRPWNSSSRKIWWILYAM